MHNRILRTCWAFLAVALIFVSTAKAQTTSCSIGYSVTATWGGGFNGGITIYNTGTTTIPTWTLGFAFANGQKVSTSWNSTYSQSGANVTLTNGQYTSNIAPGGNVNSIGFTATWNNTTNAVPTAFTLNGVACSIAPTVGTFTLSGPSSVSIAQGGGGGAWINVNGSGGFNGTVSFIVSGLPSGVIYGFSPNPGGSGTWLQLNLPNNVAAGSYPITVKGTTGNQSATTSVSLIVPSSASFTLSGPSSIALTQGNYNGGQINITDSGGFNGSVTLSVSGLPTGANAGFATNPSTTGSWIEFGASTSTPPGSYPVTITGTSGTFSSSTTVSLVVTSLGSFNLSSSPSSLTVQPGGSCPTQIGVVGVNAFTEGSEEPAPPTLHIGPEVDEAQRKRLSAVRQRRNQRDVDAALATVAADAAIAEVNLMPAILDAVRAYATVGEIVGALGSVFGRWAENPVV